MSDNIYIIGSSMTKFGRHQDKSVKDLTGMSLNLVLKDSDLTIDDIESAWFSNSSWGMSEFQHSIRGQVALSANGLENIPIINVENACAGGSSALHSAWMSIKAGLYECVLAIGTEKMYYEDFKDTILQGFIAGTDVEESKARMASLEKESKDQGNRFPAKRRKRSIFMDNYAEGARQHVAKYGSTQRQLAIIAAKNHNNSTMNPLAQYTFPQTVEQVMNDREVVYPLTRAMCAPIGDGSAAAIVCSESFLKKKGLSRAVKIRASVIVSGHRFGEKDAAERGAIIAYETAGLGPNEIDVAEVHDASAFGELEVTEQLGFCPTGDGGLFAQSGATSLGGIIPVNPSGGLISRGHPIGASGLAMTYELVTQLRGEAGKRQVKTPRFGLAENGGGNLGVDTAAMAIHIFEKC